MQTENCFEYFTHGNFGLLSLFSFCFRNTQYENFHVDQKGYDQMYDGEDLETPPSPDRPPPRPIGTLPTIHLPNKKKSSFLIWSYPGEKTVSIDLSSALLEVVGCENQGFFV